MRWRPAQALQIKPGDNTRTLVGIAAAYPGGSTWSAYFTDVCSLFNPKHSAFGAGIQQRRDDEYDIDTHLVVLRHSLCHVFGSRSFV